MGKHTIDFTLSGVDLGKAGLVFGKYDATVTIEREGDITFHVGNCDVPLSEALEAALKRARVVGVLDAWATARPALARRYETMSDVCVLWDSVSGRHIYTGDTPDAARAAAAKAIEAGEVG